MAVNHYFQGGNGIGNTNEQRLHEDLIIEGLRIYGHDVYYLPRTLVNRDLILGEDSLSKFDDSYLIEMYVETSEGFSGERELINKFGLEIREDTTFVLAKRRWNDAVDSVHTMIKEGRPNEGDIIYYPLMNSFFEISFVEDQEPFFQLGNLPVYKLRARRWEYSSEQLNTGVTEIDSAEDQYSLDQLNHQTSLESDTYNAIGTTSLTSNHPFAVDSVTITQGGEYTTAPTVTFSAPTGGGNETSIVKFGSRSYKSTGSAITVPTTGVSDLQHGSVGFWFYVSDNYSGVKTIVEFGANDNDTEKYSVSLQESGGTVQSFLQFPLNATSSGKGASTLSTDLTTGEWHFLQLAQIDQAFNQRQIHLDNDSSFSTASYKGNIIDDNGFIIDPNESLSDGDVFFDEFYATTVNSEITLPTATLSGQSGEVYFQGGERVTATGTAVLTGEEVTSVTINNAGSNYTSAPTITFADSGKVGSILLENDSVSGDKNYLLLETYNIQTQSTYADNLDLDTEAGFDTASLADDILDFTERNPFGEVDF